MFKSFIAGITFTQAPTRIKEFIAEWVVDKENDGTPEHPIQAFKWKVDNGRCRPVYG